MPIRQSITSEARRADRKREGKARHPMLKVGSKHYAVWQIIVQEGNPVGGISSANIKNATHLFHPQILADLQAAYLVKTATKRNGFNLYVADPSGRGVKLQSVDIDLELYETSDGAFLTRTVLHGRVAQHGKVVRMLAKRTVRINIPLIGDDGVIDVSGDITIDAPDNVITPKEDPGIIEGTLVK